MKKRTILPFLLLSTSLLCGCDAAAEYIDVTAEINSTELQESIEQVKENPELQANIDFIADIIVAEIKSAFGETGIESPAQNVVNQLINQDDTVTSAKSDIAANNDRITLEGLLDNAGVGDINVNNNTSKDENLEVDVPTSFSICSPYEEGFYNELIPEYCGEPYVYINGNKPFIKEYTTEVFEYFSDLDSLGRCGYTYANVCKELMPTEERGEIGSIKPTGWKTVKYDFVDGKYLYNRCHLLGYQLTGENANEKNLITGTRNFNIAGMLPFENMVAEQVNYRGDSVLYRVTPVFEGNNLVATGVLMEAYSIDDNGISDGELSFCVFAYNTEPGVTIDYATGDNWLTE